MAALVMRCDEGPAWVPPDRWTRRPKGRWTMRFAYADPPYPGQAKRWYGNHPDYAGEVDHAELIARLEQDYPDGWALSTSAPALQDMLALAPRGVRVGIWNRTNSEPPGNRGHWWWSWEPVIICRGRNSGTLIRDLISTGQPGAAGAAGRFPGGKPEAFCRWMFGLLGAEASDELDDLFPGSGAVGYAWERYCQEGWLQPTTGRVEGKTLVRQLAAQMDPLWGDA